MNGFFIKSSAKRYAYVKKVAVNRAKCTHPLTHLHIAVFTKSFIALLRGKTAMKRITQMSGQVN